MIYTPHDYQEKAIEKAREALHSGKPLALVGPVSCGKGVMQAALLEREPELIQTVPSLEIGLSIYRKLTGDDSILEQSENFQRQATEAHRIYTTMRYHNLLMAGVLAPPRFLSDDEGHHSTDNTHELVWALCANCPRVMWTGTYYQGTPQGTKALRDMWGEPYTIITLREAVKRGVVSMPNFETWPLMNDELIDIVNGEFATRAVEGLMTDSLDDLIIRVRAELFDDAAGRWKRATMFSVTTVAGADALTAGLRAAELPALSIVGDTSRRDREATFKATVDDLTHALVQVKVVGEGVDLNYREQVDLSPTMSPRFFMQRTGRTMRPVKPGEPPPRVIICNHNLTRHAYLFEGLIPAAAIRQAQTCWGKKYKPSRRTMARALGLEGFGKFVVSSVPCLDGSLLSIYALQSQDGLHQYVVLLHPCKAEPLFFERYIEKTGERATFTKPDGTVIEYDEKKYKRWKKIKTIPDATGYVSIKPDRMTSNMEDWWKNAAKYKGLDPTYEPNAREFMCLPVLSESGIRFKPE